MPAEITMPQLSDTMTEGTLIKWLKKEGDKVKEGENVAEIETDKAVMEMQAFESGTLAHVAVHEGQKAAVGAAIAVLATGKENPQDVKKQYASGDGAGKSAASAGRAEGQPTGVAQATIEAAATGEIHEPDAVGHPGRESEASAKNGNGDRRRISPLARRIAAETGIDLSRVQGSGPGGRITQRDVLEAVEGRPAAAPGPTPQAAPAAAPASRAGAGKTQVIPLTKMRSVIAARLQQSKQTIPHFYTTVDIDVEAISQLRVRLNKQLESEKIRLSIGDFVAKGVAAALVQNPAINAHFAGNQIVRHGSVNLGMAVALPEGLIVPVLRGIETMGLKEIRTRSADLVDRARAQRLRQDEMSGATFTVSNLGSYGVREFSAIVNPPEVGILAVAAAEKRPVVRGDQIVARTILTVTLSVDHRAVDGANAAEFLKTLKGMLEEPGSCFFNDHRYAIRRRPIGRDAERFPVGRVIAPLRVAAKR